MIDSDDRQILHQDWYESSGDDRGSPEGRWQGFPDFLRGRADFLDLALAAGFHCGSQA